MAATLVLPMAGCVVEDDDGPAEEIGESIDEAGDELEDAADEVEDAADG